jgi:hypothetical protein
MRLADFFLFIQERYNIYVRKTNGEDKPWSKDPIFQSYRFCNVHRENDTVTKWIRSNITEKHKGDPDLWFNIVIARLLNEPDSIKAVGYVKEWDFTKFIQALELRASVGARIFNPAYIVSTNGVAMDKPTYIAARVLTPLWAQRLNLRPQKGELLGSYAMRLIQCMGLGSFLTGQVVADLKAVPPLETADDWWTFVVSGPGSKRGLNRVYKLDPHKAMNETTFRNMLADLHGVLDNILATKNTSIPKLDAQNLQNCLCEFDKYERVRLGEGRPKQLYPGV